MSDTQQCKYLRKSVAKTMKVKFYLKYGRNKIAVIHAFNVANCSQTLATMEVKFYSKYGRNKLQVFIHLMLQISVKNEIK